MCVIELKGGSGTSIYGESLTALDRVCVDRGCEELSVLAAGVISKVADVGFIDGVQE